MRILLQSFEIGFYLDTSGDWTNVLDLARNFPNTRKATEFKIHRRLANAFVIVQPEPALPVNVTGTHNNIIMHAQEPANPGNPVEAIQVKTTKEGHSVTRTSDYKACH